MMENVSTMCERVGEEGRVTVNDRGTVKKVPSTRSTSGGRSGGSEVVRKGEPRTVPRSRLNRGVSSMSAWAIGDVEKEGEGEEEGKVVVVMMNGG
jgi:hypothetical protein